MKRIFLVVIILSLLHFLTLCARPALAKKKIGSKKTAGFSWGITVSPRLRKDRKALTVNFSSLQNANSFTYELTYLADGIDQGVYGSVTPKGENSTVRELLFGTCSHGVCRYHTNIENMRFTVTANLKNGKKTIRKYLVKP